jgi:hypothetical protein
VYQLNHQYQQLAQIYSKPIAVIKSCPSGLDFPLQTAFWQNNITMWNPTTATVEMVQELIQLHYQL